MQAATSHEKHHALRFADIIRERLCSHRIRVESNHFPGGLPGWALGCRIPPSLSPSRHGPGCGAYMVLQCAQLPGPAPWVQPLSGHNRSRGVTGSTVSPALLFLRDGLWGLVARRGEFWPGSGASFVM
jgi:hypothetical protein